MQKTVNFNDVAIVIVKENDYRFFDILYISKDEAINLLRNADLAEKAEHLKHKNILSHIKLDEEIITFGYIETEKHEFHHYKNPIFIEDEDTDTNTDSDNALVSNKTSSGEK